MRLTTKTDIKCYRYSCIERVKQCQKGDLEKIGRSWESEITYTVESRYNAVVGVQKTGPRYKWIAL